jgi:hypothetical protein
MAIYCPGCENAPPTGPVWSCSCGSQFAFFEDNGRCGSCSKVWEAATCPSCSQSSLLADWHHEAPAAPGLSVDGHSEPLDQTRVPQPKNPAARVTRYMGVDKFTRLLRSRSLYLARLDKFSDAFEGSLPKPVIAQLSSGERTLASLLGKPEDRKTWSRQFYASCWFMSEHESDPMWRLYGGGAAGGVCVVSTYQKLANIVGDGQVHIGPITYLDYQTESFEWWSDLAPVMHKRVAFAQESEVRILLARVCDFFLSTLEESIARLERQPEGYRLPCSPDAFVTEVLVNPYASDEYYATVLEATRKFAPELEPRVRWSEIRGIPVW